MHERQVLYIFRNVSTDTEDDLIKGLNNYRISLNLSALQLNDNADCLADEVSEELEDQPCSNSTTTMGGTGGLQLRNYQDLLDKCDLTLNSTREGAVLPVCVPKLVPTLLLSNYTRSSYAKYLNDSKYTGVGIASEDDWMVVVLTTNTPGGNFATSGGGVGNFGLVKVVFGHYYATLLLIMRYFCVD
ncbi:hypothetical protein RJ641_020683 [Dillenia turbinata]|uniref:Uncharacterized GPI-anchored protein At5g19230-like domain-containing protein n=1 Tax=Dillenia turbinata TaxID=194707 RepID=A0AAN8UQE9_9MAGN